MKRANPFGDLDDLSISTKPKPVDTAGIARIADENGFPSRQPPAKPPMETRREQRRYRTGRNQQMNLKTSVEAYSRFYELAKGYRTLGECFEAAVDALEKLKRGRQ